MSNFRLESTNEVITSNSGIIIAGLILNSAEFKNHINNALGRQSKYAKNHFTDYEIIKCYIGLLCVGKTSYESIDIFKYDEAFKKSLELPILPSKESLRQRLEKLPDSLNEVLQDFTAGFIKKYGDLPTISGTNYVPVDFDVTPFDNSNSQKEGVSFTYKKFMGFAPMMTYIGATGYMLNNEFREGKAHSNCAGTNEYIRRTLELARKITADQKLLLRFDSGNDSATNITEIIKFERAFYLIKRNLRNEKRDEYINLCLFASSINETIRKGKEQYFSDSSVFLAVKTEQGVEYVETRQVVRVTETLTDRNDQILLFPTYEVDVWYTNIEEKYNPKEIVDMYKDHATSEQFHSELKTDMDVERLPSGKFETNKIILSSAMVAFNILRLIGQEMINSGSANRKRKVKRLRIRKVIQDIMYMAGKFMIKYNSPTIIISKINRFFDAFCYLFKKLQPK